MIRFGRVKRFDGARVIVALTGFDGEGTIEALLLQPCGVASPSVWFPPSAGDVVVVAYDDERPENSVVLGVTYPDGKTPPRTGASEIALQAEKVYIGDNVKQAKACPRDDRLQTQLKAIKSELDSFAQAFSSHNHTVSLVTAADAAAIVGAASSGLPATTGMQTGAPTPTHSNGYSVGQTASDSVEVK